MAELSDSDIVILAASLDRSLIFGLGIYMGLRRLGATVLRMGEASPDVFLEFLAKAKPTAVVAEPSYLLRIGAQAERVGVSLRRSSVRKLICAGELIRQANFSLNDLGQGLAETWGARLFSLYGHEELSTTLCECEAGCGGHLHPELMHVEIVDELGQPLPDGEMGEVCVTPFGITAVPVLRYRTGTLAFLHTAPCACGRHTPRLGFLAERRSP